MLFAAFQRNTIAYSDQEICLSSWLLRDFGWHVLGLHQISFPGPLDDHVDFPIESTCVL